MSPYTPALPAVDALTAGLQRHALGYKPERPGIYVRISKDRTGEEKGVTRQVADGTAKARRDGWGTELRIYNENDTSAFKKRKVTLPDGSIGYRVLRPVYRQALRDLQDGVIDGLLVYDLDRLARETRDLDDLIDIVKATGRPVKGVTSEIDLMTPDGQLTARILVSAAQKSSQDTSRRVTRALAEKARTGEQRVIRRPFGWNADNRTLHPVEAPVARAMIEAVASGGSLADAYQIIVASGLSTSMGKVWTRVGVRQYLRLSRLAGVRSYRGLGRADTLGRADWEAAIVYDADGEPQRGDWEPIVDFPTWVTANQRLDARRSDQTWRHTHLLSGILRCGLCGAGLGTRPNRGSRYYVCRGRAYGTCGRLSRKQAPVDNFITEYVAAWLANQEGPVPTEPAAPLDPQIALLEERIERIEQGYAAGDPAITDQVFFVMLPEMRRQVASLHEATAKAPGPTMSYARMLATWTDPEATVTMRRSVLERLFEGIVVLPVERRGRAVWDPDKELRLIWKKVGA